MDPLSLLVTGYSVHESVLDNLKTVESNKNQFKLLGDRVDELGDPIRIEFLAKHHKKVAMQ